MATTWQINQNSLNKLEPNNEGNADFNARAAEQAGFSAFLDQC